MSSIIIYSAHSMCEIPFCIHLTSHTIFGVQCDTPQLMWIVFFIMIRNEIPPLGNSNCEGATTAAATARKRQIWGNFNTKHNNNGRKWRRRRNEAKSKCMFTLFQKVLLLHSFYWTFCSSSSSVRILLLFHSWNMQFTPNCFCVRSPLTFFPFKFLKEKWA